MIRFLLIGLLLLSPIAVPAQTTVEQIVSGIDRAAQREVERLRRALEGMRQQSVLTSPLPIGASLPEDAPRFSTRAGCVAALGLASVGGQGRLVCRAVVERFPFKGADPTPARLETMSLPAFSDRG